MRAPPIQITARLEGTDDLAGGPVDNGDAQGAEGQAASDGQGTAKDIIIIEGVAGEPSPATSTADHAGTFGNWQKVDEVPRAEPAKPD